MEITIALIALGIALWQLQLQRAEVRLNSRVNSLIHIAALLREKISHYERIISDLKTRSGNEWRGHASRVNNELRPLLTTVDHELVEILGKDAGGLDVPSIRRVLKLYPEGEVGRPAPSTASQGTLGTPGA